MNYYKLVIITARNEKHEMLRILFPSRRMLKETGLEGLHRANRKFA